MHAGEQFNPLDLDVKKHYSLRENYWIIHDAVRTIRHYSRLRAGEGEQYASRIMLAVTEVNGCGMCAYAHTKFALEAGIDSNEVRDILGGVTSGAPDRELPALAFAQHYADNWAYPDTDAWDRLVAIYGDQEALGVLGATRMMMAGNAVGIPLSLLRSRLRGQPQSGSSLPREVGSTVGVLLVLPIAIAHSAWSTLRGKPLWTARHRGTAEMSDQRFVNG